VKPFVDKICLFRITALDRRKLETLLFRRYPRREWGTFFQFGFRVTPWGLHVTFVKALEPRLGDFDENSGIVEFSAGYILRAQLSAEESPLGIGVIHSHPEGCGTGASSLDKDMDAYFASEFGVYGNGRPYVSLRIAKDSNGEFRFSGEAWINGERMTVTRILTIGPTLTREGAESHRRHEDQANATNERVGELIGKSGPRRISEGAVGVIGCSGLGSPSVHVLARAGVRRFVLVDPERFADSNHERFHASKSSDLGNDDLKVELVRRMILEINPDAQVVIIRGSVPDDNVLDYLLQCDLVLSCTDTQHSRAALSDYATHYLLPCLDAAVLMRAKNGKLTEQVGEFARYTADEPCAWCLGRINQSMMWYELMPPEEREQRKRAALEAADRGLDGRQYWGGEPPRELTVGYMTTAVGAMLAGFAHGMITGSFAMAHQRFQFDLGMPMLAVVPAEKPAKAECSCRHTKGWADQSRADRSVTKPLHFERAVVME